MKPRAHHRPTPRLLAVALASVLAFGAPAALAQSTSATVRGTAAASARVTATNTATGFARSAAADANGNYVLAGLPPGTYRIEVAGGGTRTVTLAIGQNVTVDVGGGGPTELEVVEVVGATVNEPRTSEVATYVSEKKIDALPQTSRNFLSFADTVPGVIFEQNADGSTKMRSGAQNSNGVNVFIDGVGQKNYVTKGGVSGQDSSRGNPFPQLAIGEYKVITSNYKAEYDQISSAAVTAVTKSGTNDFGGSFFWDRSSDHWRARTPREEDADLESDTQTEQWGMSVSGPIIQDRLFYFVTYEGKDIASPRTVSPGQIAGGLALPPQLVALTGPTASPFTEDLWFGKLTWQPGDDHLLEFSIKQREETEITGVDGLNTFEYGTSKTNDSTRADLRWQFNQEDWLSDAHLTYEDEEWSPHATTVGPGIIFTGTQGNPFEGVVLNTGGGRDFQEKGQNGWSLQEDFTYFGIEGHTLKAGFKYKAVEINAFEQQPYNPQYFVDLPNAINTGADNIGEYVPWRVEFGALIPGAPSRNIVTKAKQFGIYLQDDWQVTEKLLLNLGLRWDYEENPGYEDYVTPANLVAALRAWPALHGPNTDYDIENYISNGSNRDAFKDAWQPRLGFSYDLFADERHVVFGGAGRTYDRNLWDYLALEQSKSTYPQYRFQFNTPDHPCTTGVNNCVGPWSPIYYDRNQLNALVAANPNLGAEVNLMNNDLDTPYSDQFSLGMRNAFNLWGQDWSLSTTAVHIRSHDGIVFTLGSRFPDGSFRNPAVPGATWGSLPFIPIPGFGTLIKADNGIETRLNQFLVGLDKGYTTESPWSLTVAYTYSDAEENRFNAASSDEHYLLDYPSTDGLPFQMSAGVPEHRLVVSGFADIFWDMTFSGKLTLASPYPKESTNCHDTISFDNCFFDEFVPPGDIGYKTLDMSLRKAFNTGTSFTPWVRVDVINLLNWDNWTDYDTWRGGPTDTNPNFGEVNGFGINGDTRTWKLSVGFDF